MDRNYSGTVIRNERFGICPQENNFIPYLNCWQHVNFFISIYAKENDDINRETFRILDKINLIDDKFKYSHELSGGMKRCLSLGIVLAQKPECIILDEPETGMDLHVQNKFFKLIHELKKQITIILTTHDLLQAKYLADELVILYQGKITNQMEINSFLTAERTLYIKGKIKKENQTKITSFDFDPNKFDPKTGNVVLLLKQNDLKKYEQLKELDLKQIKMSNTDYDKILHEGTPSIQEFNNHSKASSLNIDLDYQIKNEIPAWAWLKKTLLTRALKKTLIQIYAVIYLKMKFMKRKWYFMFILLLPVIFLLVSVMTISVMRIRPEKNNFNIQIGNGVVYFHGEKFSKCVFPLDSQFRLLSLKKAENVKKTNPGFFFENVLGHVEEKKGHITIFSNANYVHGMSMLLNFVHNMLAHNGSICDVFNKKIEKIISLDKAPINPKPEKLKISTFTLNIYFKLISIGWFICMQLFVIFPHLIEKTKHSHVEKTPSFIFWPVFYFIDLFIFTCALLFFSLTHVLLFKNDDFFNMEETLTIIQNVFLYGSLYLLIIYVLTVLLKSFLAISCTLILMYSVSLVLALITQGEWMILVTFLPDFVFMYKNKLLDAQHWNLTDSQRKTRIPISNAEINISVSVYFIFLVCFLLLMTRRKNFFNKHETKYLCANIKEKKFSKLVIKMELDEGCYNLCGYNGIGKTTILEIIAGIRHLLGKISTCSKTIGYCPQENCKFLFFFSYFLVCFFFRIFSFCFFFHTKSFLFSRLFFFILKIFYFILFFSYFIFRSSWVFNGKRENKIYNVIFRIFSDQRRH